MTLRCEIVVEGRLGPRLDGLIDGFDSADAGKGKSVLRGTVENAASLQPVLNRLADFGIKLIGLTTSPEEPGSGPSGG